jgi:hypothetical protein
LVKGTGVLFGKYLERDSGYPGEKNRSIGRRSCGASDIAGLPHTVYTAIIWPETVDRLAIFGKQLPIVLKPSVSVPGIEFAVPSRDEWESKKCLG